MAPPRKLSERDNQLIDIFALRILDQRQKHNGRVPRGVMHASLQFLREGPRAIPVTRDMMKGRIKLLSAKQKASIAVTVPAEIEIDGASVASAITRATFDVDDDASTTSSLASSDHPRIESHKKKSLEQLRTRLLNEVTLEHVRLHELKEHKKDRLARGTLEKLIQQKRIQLGLPDSVKISGEREAFTVSETQRKTDSIVTAVQRETCRDVTMPVESLHVLLRDLVSDSALK